MPSIKRNRPLGSHPVYWFSFGTLPPEDWTPRPVKALARSFKGKLPRQVLERPTKNSEPYLLMDGLRGGTHVYTEETHLPSVTATDSILIGDGSKSGYALRGVAGVLGSTLVGFRAGPATHPSFLYHQLSSLFPYLSATVSGSAVPHLDAELLDRLELSTPEKDEQTAIARILDAADSAIERARVAVEKAGRIRVGILQRFFAGGLGKTSSADRHVGPLAPGWRLVRVSELLAESPKNGISPAASSQPPGLPTFSIAAVRNGRVNLSSGEHLKYVRLDSELAERFGIKRGDLLVVRGNANPDLVGRCGVVGDFPAGCIYPDILIRLVFKSGEDGLLPEYAATVWNHHLVHNQVFKRAKTSNGTLKINSQDVRRIIVPIPPRDEQVSLNQQLQHADAVIAAQGRRLVALERLKRGLMQDLLTGRVRVKTSAAALAATV